MGHGGQFYCGRMREEEKGAVIITWGKMGGDIERNEYSINDLNLWRREGWSTGSVIQ